MLLNGKTILSSLVASVVFLAVFFFILPWLFLVLAVVLIAVLVSVFFRRGSINITTVRITNTPHGDLIRTIKTVSSTMERTTGRELRERLPDTDITIYPDG